MTTFSHDEFPYIVWKIKEIHKVSCLFYPQNVLIGRVELKLELTACKSSTENYFSLSLKANGDKASFKPISFSVYIKDANGINRFTQYSTFTADIFHSSQKLWMVKRNDLIRLNCTCIEKDILTIVCMSGPEGVLQKSEFTVASKAVPRYGSISNRISSYSGATSCLENLSHDIQKLLDSNIPSDVSLVCGDSTIAAHKTVLSARSNVFAAMFRNEMTESQEGIVKIDDIEATILDQFIQYIYSGRLPNLSEVSARSLYVAADKYAIESLKKRCFDFMTENLNEETAFDLLVLADAHSDRDLKESIISFVARSPGLLRSEDWLIFWKNKPQLAFEAYTEYVKISKRR